MSDQNNWPANKIEIKSVESLLPYARNARTHSDEQVAQLAGSIKEWGWTTPVLIDESNQIIAGHGRILAARKLGINNVPVMVAKNWSEAQKKAYVLADNKLALNAGWDLELLKVEISDIDNTEINPALIGFSDEELAQLTFDGNFEPGTESDQSRLDQKKKQKCPSCGYQFEN